MCLHLWPLSLIHLGWHRLSEIHIDLLKVGVLEEFCIELRFDRTNRNEVSVGAFVGVVEVRGRIQQVCAAIVRPHAHGFESPDHSHERGRPIHHRSVNDLSLA
ncbi:unannotated protein [freshwater metagenome]|uniref:Unannotated protein n=1 Tax=freshwater metagenome TaxID=449393 RepID=A0A6J7US72_9ZZZZ